MVPTVSKCAYSLNYQILLKSLLPTLLFSFLCLLIQVAQNLYMQSRQGQVTLPAESGEQRMEKPKGNAGAPREREAPPPRHSPACAVVLMSLGSPLLLSNSSPFG